MADKLSPEHFFLLALLMVATLPLGWKAKLPERRLPRLNDGEALLYKPASEFTLIVLLLAMWALHYPSLRQD